MVPAKLKHFLWKISSRSIATENNLKRKHVTRDAICKRWWLEEETEEHFLFNCPYAKRIWRGSGTDNTIIDNLTTSYEEKLEAFYKFLMWLLWTTIKIFLFGSSGEFGRAKICYYISIDTSIGRMFWLMLGVMLENGKMWRIKKEIHLKAIDHLTEGDIKIYGDYHQHIGWNAM